MPNPEEALEYYAKKKEEEQAELGEMKKSDESYYETVRQKNGEKLYIIDKLYNEIICTVKDQNTQEKISRLRDLFKYQLYILNCIDANRSAFEQLVREEIGVNRTSELVDKLNNEHLEDGILAKMWPYSFKQL